MRAASLAIWDSVGMVLHGDLSLWMALKPP